MEIVTKTVFVEFLEDDPGNAKPQVRICDLFFAQVIEKYGCILFDTKKSVRVKKMKKKALSDVLNFMLVQKELILTEAQVYKKLNNMKARVKAKKSENKVLNKGEEIILRLMTIFERSKTLSFSDSRECECFVEV